jgi:hypothetical protein
VPQERERPGLRGKQPGRSGESSGPDLTRIWLQFSQRSVPPQYLTHCHQNGPDRRTVIGFPAVARPRPGSFSAQASADQIRTLTSSASSAACGERRARRRSIGAADFPGAEGERARPFHWDPASRPTRGLDDPTP